MYVVVVVIFVTSDVKLNTLVQLVSCPLVNHRRMSLSLFSFIKIHSSLSDLIVLISIFYGLIVSISIFYYWYGVDILT